MSWGAVTTGGSDLYLPWDSGKKYRGRLMLGMFGGPSEPITAYYHQVPTVVDPQDNKKMLRTFSTQLCHFEFDPEGTCRCGLCGREDPLWNYLNDDDKYFRDQQKNIKGNKHFNVVTQHIILIWAYDFNGPRIIKQGHNLFKELRKVVELKGTDRDFIFWKEVDSSKGKMYGTSYNVVPDDPSSFNPGIELDASAVDMTEVVRRELPGHPKFIWEYVNGRTPDGKPLITRNNQTDVKFLGGTRFVVSTVQVLPEGQQMPEEDRPAQTIKEPPRAITPPVSEQKTATDTQNVGASTPPNNQVSDTKKVESVGDEEPDMPNTETPSEPMTLEKAKAFVCTLGKKHKGETYEQIAIVHPTYFTWLIGQLADPKQKEAREAALVIQKVIDTNNGVWPGAPQPTKTETVVAPAENITVTSIVDRDALQKEVETLMEANINIQDETALGEFMNECAKDLKPIQRYQLSNWNVDQLTAAKNRLTSM
jgi:hypothetical protein